MLVLAYVGYGVFVFILAAVFGTYIAARRGKANPNFGSTGFVVVALMFFGLPCYFIGSYLRNHGNEKTSFIVLLIASIIGLFLGLKNRA